ncbi:MAG: hypothetical protein K8U03_05705 [Planctomycetia bacterium]|nr:hypothetical protein [Planctomycetia bacterium]
MVEHLFRVRLNELITVRVVCMKCRAAIEVSPETLSLRGEQCRGCGTVLVEQRDNRLVNLGMAIRELTSPPKAGQPETFYVEFAVPIKDTV